MLPRLALVFRFSGSPVPIVDTTAFLKGANYGDACKRVTDALHTYGSVIIKDPRVQEQHNIDFLTMMENYFESRAARFYANEPVEDFFPQLSYQVGATPEFVEKARRHDKVVANYSKENCAYTPQPPPYDAKWRFFWPVSESGSNKKNEDFDPPRFAPKDIPEWQTKMDLWGNMMIQGCMTVAEMAAVGLDLKPDTFTSKMRGGPHLLAPTGSDLKRYSIGTVFAGFHYDLNFLTIHGKNRYPGLFVWLRNGQRIKVAVPEGHLLLQAGKQFEILTGGFITCGYHEVIYTEDVKKKLDAALQAKQSWWRVSSTLFSHINQKVVLEPTDKFKTQESIIKYRPILAKDQVEEELKAISLRLT